MRTLFFILLLTISNQAMASSLTISISNEKNKLLENAVITLTPTAGQQVKHTMVAAPSMEQENTLFHPFVLPVSTGVEVMFPNKDDFRHHVYSFSKAKKLELRLYGKDEEKSIIFDKPGIAALGCNIHDNMLAFIFITDAPVFLKSDAAGQVTFTDLPDGPYQLNIWHPDLKSRTAIIKQVTIKGQMSGTQEIVIKTRRSSHKQTDPSDRGNY